MEQTFTIGEKIFLWVVGIVCTFFACCLGLALVGL